MTAVRQRFPHLMPPSVSCSIYAYVRDASVVHDATDTIIKTLFFGDIQSTDRGQAVERVFQLTDGRTLRVTSVQLVQDYDFTNVPKGNALFEIFRDP